MYAIEFEGILQETTQASCNSEAHMGASLEHQTNVELNGSHGCKPVKQRQCLHSTCMKTQERGSHSTFMKTQKKAHMVVCLVPKVC